MDWLMGGESRFLTPVGVEPPALTILSLPGPNLMVSPVFRLSHEGFFLSVKVKRINSNINSE